LISAERAARKRSRWFVGHISILGATPEALRISTYGTASAVKRPLVATVIASMLASVGCDIAANPAARMPPDR
jgi:hypothetical protein